MVRPSGDYETSGGGRGVALCNVSERGSGNQHAGERHVGAWPRTRGLQTPPKTVPLRKTCPCANPNTDTIAESASVVTLVPRKKPGDCGGALRAGMQSTLDGGDDGDGGDGAARKRTPDLRTSSTAELPQVVSSWLES